jgi:sodium/potassium-transporting ATPase subunit beta
MGEGKKAGDEHKFQFYDKEKGTFLGRTGSSWLKITVFYIAYFAFLAGLFTASIQIMQSQLPEDKPKLNTRLNIPGLHYFPKFDLLDADQKERSKANEDGIAFYYNGADGDQGYQYYIDQTNAEFKKYETATEGSPKPEEYSTAELGSCSSGNFGWDENKPCIFFRLNRVINWEPVGLFKPEADTFFAKDGNGPQKPMVRDATYVRCQAKDQDNTIVDAFKFQYIGGDSSGGDGYFDQKYFPYKGKLAQKKYESPVVAVKILGEDSNGLAEGNMYKVKCQAFGANFIGREEKRKDGFAEISFTIMNGSDE